MRDAKGHPRPDFCRTDWMDLNGVWQFSFDEAEAGLREKWYLPEKNLDTEIRVPFCYQSAASGIGLEKIVQRVWYRRKFVIPSSFAGRRILLRFGAVDYEAAVYVNGRLQGVHQGGYTPFALDITEALEPGENDLCLMVTDRPDREQPRGKQYWREGWKRCWYVPCTGVWQSVWLEAVSSLYLESVHITPDITTGMAFFTIRLNRAPSARTDAELAVSLEGEEVTRVTVRLNGKNTEVGVSMLDPAGVEQVRLWTPKDPALYDVRVRLISENEVQDEVFTYFGMRKIECRKGYILLNDRAVYLRMALDQGYWPESLMTPPSDDAIRQDVEWTLKLGFNGARKHQKIEDPRYYYWADRLGLLVWGELPAAFEFSHQAVCGTAETMAGMIDRDFNHPSVIAWVPVNESWGMTGMYANRRMQSCARMLYHLCKGLDPTRLVSTNDGWELVETDLIGLHDYTGAGNMLAAHFNDRERMENYAADSRMCFSNGFEPAGNEPLMITEFGGIAMDGKGEGWGYNGKVKDEAEFLARFADQMAGLHAIRACRGYCYTQLTDVRQEVNGLLTADRRPKIDPERFAMLNRSPEPEKADF